MANDPKKTKIKTSRFGELEFENSSIIEIVPGIIGFPTITRFILLDYNPPFSWLQAVDNSDLAFVVVNGAEFGENYSFDLPVGDPDIELTPTDDCSVINLVSVRPPPHETTVNLKAPLIVNLRNRRGKQIILDDQRFPTRYPLWANPEEESKEESQR